MQYKHDITEHETFNHIIYNLNPKIYEITLANVKREMNDPNYVPTIGCDQASTPMKNYWSLQSNDICCNRINKSCHCESNWMDETNFGSQIWKDEHKGRCGTMQTSIKHWTSTVVCSSYPVSVIIWWRKKEFYDITLHPDAMQNHIMHPIPKVHEGTLNMEL
jgi:hypothetical protein